MSRHGAAWPRHIYALRTVVSRLTTSKGPLGYQRGPSTTNQGPCLGQYPRLFIKQLATSEACTDASSSGALAQRKEKVIVLTGATAAGKTKASIELAQRCGGEIISADSVQVFSGLDVGSDKVTSSVILQQHLAMQQCLCSSGRADAL